MKLLVVYYSLYGNTLKMARAVAGGAETVKGAEATLMRVPDIPRDGGAERNERIKNTQIIQKGIPVARPADLAGFDAIVWGSPTRYGSMCAQMKHFIDQTGQAWTNGELENKPAGVFTCGSLLRGGQESTLLTMIVPLLHLGMLIVGIPYSANGPGKQVGGSPYGASAVVGHQSDQPPSEEDLAAARILGTRVAQTAREREGKSRWS